MAYDAKREDYQRMAIRYARSLDSDDPVTAARAFANFGRRLAQERDSLPQTDSDRAFHLVADATELIDYELPFAAEDRAQEIITKGHALLAEAKSLDPECFDAVRMDADAVGSFEDRYRQLVNMEPEVLASCRAARDREGTTLDERTKLAQDVAMRPWRRWVAATAELALICGRNRECLKYGEKLLEDDPADTAGVHLTMMLAHAKLEEELELEMLSSRCGSDAPLGSSGNAWMLLSRIAVAQKDWDMPTAKTQLRRLVQSYPHAVRTLVRQTELPDGEFSRILVTPYSEDELIVAVSEATVLLDEGADQSGRGPLGLWMAQEAARLDPQEASETLAQMAAGGAVQ